MGQAARKVTAKALVLDEEVRCELTGKRNYHRCVGVCYLDGMNVEAKLVRQGLARDCPRFSGGEYHEIEQAAVDQGATTREICRLTDYCER